MRHAHPSKGRTGQTGSALCFWLGAVVASRFIQSAAKFSNLPTSATSNAISNQTKLFEMLVLDDEQIEDLSHTDREFQEWKRGRGAATHHSLLRPRRE